MKSRAATPPLELRLLILAPVGRDASLIETMLSGQSIACLVCRDAHALLGELARGAASVLLTEEALVEEDGRLAAAVARQPPWSDLPVLLLTRTGADSAAVTRAVGTLGNVTLLERPVRAAALLSAVKSALRARERQYQTRAHLLEREEADSRKDEFLATLAHELRNPLAPIRNAVNLLRMSARERPEIWEMMERQVSHMVRLVDDLMEVSRITRGAIELRKEAVDLGVVIAAAIETARPLVDAAGHSLSVGLAPKPLAVDADAVRLAQVFSNLINNAVKYTDAGGRIALDVRRDNSLAVVTVTDTGIGIPAVLLPKVFDMFVQADGRDRRAQGGLGIGLTLARRLVEMHGGTLTAASPGPGRGSVFTVRLPLAQADSVPSAAAASSTHTIRGVPRILVVDDNRDAADSLGALLQILGAEVRVAYEGKAALEAFPAFQPAAVFLDLGMPGMDGYEVARSIRACPRGQDTMLVALTGWGQEKDRRQTHATGFDHHLVKPAGVETLRAVLASMQ